MRFFHLSDLHIGKHLHHYNLKEDQQYLLREIISYAKERGGKKREMSRFVGEVLGGIKWK